jgi:hypothetical protein
MATRKEGQEDKTSTSPSPHTPNADPTVQLIDNAAVSSKEKRQLHLHVTRRALDQTKDNVKRSIDEVGREVSCYNSAVNDYQEQTLQDAKEIIDSYLEAQKEFIISLQSTLDKYLRTNDDGMNYYYYWVAPKWIAGTYVKTVSVIVDDMIAATRLANSMIFANIRALRTSTQLARNSAKELSRLSINTSRTLEQDV